MIEPDDHLIFSTAEIRAWLNGAKATPEGDQVQEEIETVLHHALDVVATGDALQFRLVIEVTNRPPSHDPESD